MLHFRMIILSFLMSSLSISSSFCMMNRLRPYLIGLGSITAAGAVYNNLSSSSKYEKYAVPIEMKKVLDANQQDMADTFYKKRFVDNTHIFPWLSNYVIKTSVPGRLEGREFCDMIIKQNPKTMSLLEVPVKYRYSDSVGREYVIAEKVEGVVPNPSLIELQSESSGNLDKIKSWFGLVKHEQPQQLSLEQTKQLCAFIIKSGWWDTRRDNFAVRANGRISIIDTQLQCFTKQDQLKDKEHVVQGLKILIRPDQQKYFCSECVVYIQNQINNISKT